MQIHIGTTDGSAELTIGTERATSVFGCILELPFVQGQLSAIGKHVDIATTKQGDK